MAELMQRSGLRGPGFKFGPSDKIWIQLIVGAAVLRFSRWRMLCDAGHPENDPPIGNVKNVSAAPTVITEVGVAVVIAILSLVTSGPGLT
jgi:hypothetical protein